ncbi:MAG: hypothetical protein O4808_01845 [Trichodesmium sp. St17_bin3_1_1]|nr:hypothetical protein [Trichodesmium sp. St17_bin3_1_1]
MSTPNLEPKTNINFGHGISYQCYLSFFGEFGLGLSSSNSFHSFAIA